MTASLALNDILVWSLQIGFLVALAAILPPVIGLKMPKVKLAFGHLVLVTCLLLPFVRSWRQEVIGGTVTVSTAVVSTIAQGPAVRQHYPISTPLFVLLLAAAGIVVRLGFLLSGFRRLRRYRLHSKPLTPASAWGVEADLRVSEEVASPVTFGFRKPVVLLPAGFPALSEGMRDAILCHEVLHVRRHDWLFTVGEELIRAVLWFHPAVWWLLREIQLAREQTVDREVVEMTRSRDQYIDALLVIAGAPPRVDLAPAPLFLRKRHLKQRVVSIVKEVKMSKAKSISALAASLTILAASGWFVSGEFRLEAAPQQAAPQVVMDAPGVSVETNGAQLMHRQPVEYSREAMAKGVQGTVVAEVTLDAAGNVTDARIVSGPDELRKGVLQSVLTWHFSNDAAPGVRQVSVTFEKPKAAQQTIVVHADVAPRQEPQNNNVVSNIVIGGLSDAARQQLLAQLPVRVGDAMTPEKYSQTLDTVHAFDSHLTVRSIPISPTETTALSIYPNQPPDAMQDTLRHNLQTLAEEVQRQTQPVQPEPAEALRISGEEQKANLVTQVPVAYPPLAKAAHVQGTVVFAATIGKDGAVQNLQLVSGPPLLVQAAMQSVNQWVYKPAMLNGNPVAVITNIEVNFTLAQ
jgi:TonB family protein